MTLTTILQIIIALIFIYLIVSLVVSELQEQVSALLEFRANNLKKAIDLFIGKAMRKQLYDNSLKSFNQSTNSFIRQIPKRWLKSESVGPSYIDPKAFADALIIEINRLLIEQNEQNKLSKNELLFNSEIPPSDETEKTPSGIIEKLEMLKKKKPDYSLAIDRLVEIAYVTKIKQNTPTVNHFVEEIANTFNQVMERTSGVYKRNAKGVSLLFGFLVAILLNLDSFYIITQLYQNPALTQELNQKAELVSSQYQSCLENATDNEARQECKNIANNESKNLETLSQALPIGWNDQGWFNAEQIKSQNGWLQAVLGWFVTGIAIAMGAPFWFDLLGKIINVRNTGKPISSETDSSKK